MLRAHKPHVHYGRPQLREVICQLRFPAILSIGSHEPADFQEAIRQEFPRYALRQDRLPPKGHLGLSNIRHTLQFTYHRQDLLRLSNKEDGGARAEILIPIEEEQA